MGADGLANHGFKLGLRIACGAAGLTPLPCEACRLAVRKDRDGPKYIIQVVYHHLACVCGYAPRACYPIENVYFLFRQANGDEPIQRVYSLGSLCHISPCNNVCEQCNSSHTSMLMCPQSCV